MASRDSSRCAYRIDGSAVRLQDSRGGPGGTASAREGDPDMRRFLFAWWFLLAAAPALAQPTALAAPQGTVRLTGLRSWSAPTSTRIVLDFSRRIVPVAPDSGRSPSLTISLPMDALERAAGVPAVLHVGDGVVDSVVVSPTSDTKFLFVFA